MSRFAVRWLWIATLIASLVSFAPGAGADSPGAAAVRFGAAPAWVEPLDKTTLRDVAPAGGVVVMYLGFTTRHVGAEHWLFIRGAVRAENEIGIGAVARRLFHFVPPHQRLVLHRLEIRRGQEVIPQLVPGSIEVLRREPGLENDVYDGARTAVAVLPDIRVGDVLLYEYSVVGANPVLAGHVAETWGLASPQAIGTLDYRLITDRDIRTAVFAGAAPPSVAEQGGLHVLSSRSEEVPSLETVDDALPPELRVVPTVEMSDATSWGDVASWAAPLFRLGPPGERVAAAVRELKASTTTQEGAIVAALRRVQDDVRYVSLAFAESTHRPTPPETVLARRFGDCKDKSLLLVSMLRALGVKAHVALVRSRGGARLRDELPAVDAFDHAIVAVEHEGRLVFLDPTRVRQRGRLSDVAARFVRYALILAPGTTDLTEVVDPHEERPHIRSSLHYVIKEIGGEARLEVATTFTGGYADATRAQHASQTASEFAEAVAKPILETHPRAVRVGAARVVDWPKTNEIVVSVDFTLDGAWTSDDTNDRELRLFPPYLRGVFPAMRPERKHPLLLDHPLRIVHDVSVDAGEPFRVAEVDTVADESTFKLEHTIKTRTTATTTHIDLHYDFATKTRRVEPAGFEAHRAALSAIDRLTFSLFRRAPPPPAGVPWGLYVGAGAWTLAVVGGFAAIDRRRLHLRMTRIPYDASLAGRRGWLAFLALPVSLAPLVGAWTMMKTAETFSPQAWQMFGDPAVSALGAATRPVLVFELLSTIALGIGSVYVALAYWTTRRTFPLTFVAVQLTVVAYALIDHVLVTMLHAGTEQPATSTMLASPARFVGAALWVLYVLQSKRVRATYAPPEERRPRRKKKRAAAPPVDLD